MHERRFADRMSFIPDYQTATVKYRDAIPLIMVFKPYGRAQKCLNLSAALIKQTKLKGPMVDRPQGWFTSPGKLI